MTRKQRTGKDRKRRSPPRVRVIGEEGRAEIFDFDTRLVGYSRDPRFTDWKRGLLP